MRDYISIGSTPCNEDCAQVGDEGYSAKARAECARYIAALKAHYGNPPDGASYSIKAFPHDFGSYYEVVINYDDSIEAHVDYAFNVECGLEYWPD